MVALSGKRRCSCASVVTSGGGIRLDLELRLAHINIRVNAIPAWNVPRGVCVRPIAFFFFFSSANERERLGWPRTLQNLDLFAFQRDSL